MGFALLRVGEDAGSSGSCAGVGRGGGGVDRSGQASGEKARDGGAGEQRFAGGLLFHFWFGFWFWFCWPVTLEDLAGARRWFPRLSNREDSRLYTRKIELGVMRW